MSWECSRLRMLLIAFDVFSLRLLEGSPILCICFRDGEQGWVTKNGTTWDTISIKDQKSFRLHRVAPCKRHGHHTIR